VAEDGWCITETHLSVGTSLCDIPQTKKGNPIPGQFACSGEHDCVGEVLYEIPMELDEGDTLYVAAHAVVCMGQGLPETVTMSVVYPQEGDPSHFPVTVYDGMAGAYLGWCIDIDASISQNVMYDAQVHSSLGGYPADIVNFTGNLDLVNWIINQDFPGKGSPGGYGTYTYGDVQVAIWRLLEDPAFNNATVFSSLHPAPSEDRVAEIICAAQGHEGFVPGCGDEYAVILVPVDECGNTIAQKIIIEFPVPCGCETAWGKGCDFPGRNWAMYFTYSVQSDDGLTDDGQAIPADEPVDKRKGHGPQGHHHGRK